MPRTPGGKLQNSFILKDKPNYHFFSLLELEEKVPPQYSIHGEVIEPTHQPMTQSPWLRQSHRGCCSPSFSADCPASHLLLLRRPQHPSTWCLCRLLLCPGTHRSLQTAKPTPRPRADGVFPSHFCSWPVTVLRGCCKPTVWRAGPAGGLVAYLMGWSSPSHSELSHHTGSVPCPWVFRGGPLCCARQQGWMAPNPHARAQTVEKTQDPQLWASPNGLSNS